MVGTMLVGGGVDAVEDGAAWVLLLLLLLAAARCCCWAGAEDFWRCLRDILAVMRNNMATAGITLLENMYCLCLVFCTES